MALFFSSRLKPMVRMPFSALTFDLLTVEVEAGCHLLTPPTSFGVEHRGRHGSIRMAVPGATGNTGENEAKTVSEKACRTVRRSIPSRLRLQIIGLSREI